ncbi:MAG TPA: NAD+ synthase [bacterium]|jgi:NAD+ synthase
MGFVSNAAEAAQRIRNWLKTRLQETGRQEYILGLSGGIDSALAAYMAVDAVGAEGLYCVLLPYRTSSPESLSDAEHVVRDLGVQSRVVDISAMADAFESQAEELSPVRRGNLCARLRMITLFDQSHSKGLVLGTSNKTETLLGYGTLFGDAAWSLNPLGDLYKTDVRLLSKYYGVPQAIQDKIPSADLWKGQTDEGELGHSYAEIDALLVKMVDEKKSRAEILADGTDPKLVDRVVSLMRGSAFKRQPAPIAWLSPPFSASHVEDPRW